jgi:hypothetical protein
MNRSAVLALLLLACTASCARTAAAPPAAPGALHDDAPAVDKGPSSYEGDIGGLSQEDVEEQFDALRPRLIECVRSASGRLSSIGGRVSLKMRTDRAGNVRWVYLSDSTLGDRDTERCVLRVVQSRTWPRPLSGEGLAQTSFDVDPSEAPLPLPKYKTALLAQRARAATRKCRKGIAGAFQATAYVGPAGEVLAAGVAPPDERGEEASDCIAEALRDVRIGAVAAMDHGAVAKASFPLR